MLKFFRKIRQQLLSENHFSKYLLYAIGEILLVVIGILIALQINNWNENRKAKIQEIAILQGIKNDLQSDIVQLDMVIGEYRERLSYFKKVDPTFSLPAEDWVTLSDTSTQLNYVWLMSRIQSFRTGRGNFQNSSGQVLNKELYTKIRFHYNMTINGSLSIYETIKTREENLNWNRAYEKKHQPYQKMSDLKDPQFLAELDYFFSAMRLYVLFLNNSKKYTAALIEEIDVALGNQ